MTAASDILRSAAVEDCRPWPRHVLQHPDWNAFAYTSMNEAWILLAHWADTVQAHALFLDPQALTVIPVSTPIEAGHYPALSPFLPGAAWYERMIHDLWGHTATGGTDARSWLDHGNWPHGRPMAARPEAQTAAEFPDLSGPEPEDAMVLPVGPISGHLGEAAHLRLRVQGATVRAAEALLGFSHKGTLTLMRGKSPRAAARFAARLSAQATVAHSVAFALATEAAMDVVAPPRATALRIVMMELERAAVHLDTLAELGRLADAERLRIRCGLLREKLLRAADGAFGHRLMMDCVVPGGVAADIAADGPQIVLRALGDVASELESIRRLLDQPGLVVRLTGLGRTDAKLVTALGAGGVAGRASGRAFDARTTFAPGYADLRPRLAVRSAGDAAARENLRIFEVEESLRLIGLTFDGLPEGPVTLPLPQVSGEGIACVEAAYGDVWHWLRLDHGQIAAIFPRDPGWALWPLAEHALQHAPADDTSLVRASLSLPVSGIDL